MPLRYPLHEVLTYNGRTTDRKMIRRYYDEYRRQKGTPDRCDTRECEFFSKPLIWCDKPLPLDLDHINGVTADNRPENLRFLCPNCHRQTPTFGGKNAGRVQNQNKGGYELYDKETGKRDAHIHLHGAQSLGLSGQPPTVHIDGDDE